MRCLFCWTIFSTICPLGSSSICQARNCLPSRGYALVWVRPHDDGRFHGSLLQNRLIGSTRTFLDPSTLLYPPSRSGRSPLLCFHIVPCFGSSADSTKKPSTISSSTRSECQCGERSCLTKILTVACSSRDGSPLPDGVSQRARLMRARPTLPVLSERYQRSSLMRMTC